VRNSVAAGLACLLLALAGCGGSGGPASGQPPGSTKVTLSDYKFTPNNITVKPGKVTFFLVNTGTVSHDMVVSGSDGKSVGHSELLQPGNSTVLTIDDLPSGSYTIVCDQPGHEELGMKGTITAS
jgi:plastocyanin